MLSNLQTSSSLINSSQSSRQKRKVKQSNQNNQPMFDDDQDSKFYDFSNLPLKQNHQDFPMWLCPNLRIFLQSFSPVYKEASQVLTAIAEPVSRPQHIHQYILTPFSLYAAVSVKLSRKNILTVLQKYSKNAAIPEEMYKFIHRCTRRYGKAKIVLKNNRYFIECQKKKYADELLQIGSVRSANNMVLKQQAKFKNGLRINQFCQEQSSFNQLNSQNYIDEEEETKKQKELELKQLQFEKMSQIQKRRNALREQFQVFFEVEQTLEQEHSDAQKNLAAKKLQSTYIFEISTQCKIQQIKKDCTQAKFPLLQQYDFKRDHLNPQLDAQLKDTTTIRPYQQFALSKIFSSSRSRSGIIVLPCGAGKTLVGISVACTIKKRTIILCTSSVAVEQWKQQFELWSTLDPKHIARFTSSNKDLILSDDQAGVVISTYSMIGYSGNRAKESQQIMKKLREVQWGLLILDQVQVVPAEVFRTVIHSTKSHCKLGLTATLVRQDNKIEDLNFLIGPKLYEANWLELQRDGYLARVQCIEVWCEMTPEFFYEYMRARGYMRTLLYVNNPNKFLACQYLIQLHESKGDKVAQLI